MDKKTLETIEKWLQSNQVDDSDKNEIRKILDTNPIEAEEAFYCNLEFGTGGLRGIMGLGTNRMNKYTVGTATQGLVNYLKKSFSDDNISVVLSRDSRINSDFFVDVAASVLSANGIVVYIFDDIRPTPELSYAVRELHCKAGIMITASHNPKEYNGYKVYWEDGGQLVPPHDINVIEEVNNILSLSEVNFRVNQDLIVRLGNEIDNKYLDKVSSVCLQPDLIQNQKNLKIVYSPLHGTGYKIVPEALKRFGFSEIIETPPQNIPDGSFPTVISPNPEEKEGLSLAIRKAIETDADILVATDPDADRLGVGVKKGKGEYELLNGNQTATLITYYLLETKYKKREFKGNEMIVKTIVTTDLLTDIASKYGLKTFEVLTGFKYIAEIIRKYEGKLKFICGGEESYGFLADDFVRDKDAVLSTCIIAEVAAWAKSQHKTLLDILMDISVEFGLYREELVSITKKGISGMEEISGIMNSFRNFKEKTIAGVKILWFLDYKNSVKKNLIENITEPIDLPKSNVLQFILVDGSKITVRPSGTEPKIKFYFSVKDYLPRHSDFSAVSNKLKTYISSIKKDLNLQ